MAGVLSWLSSPWVHQLAVPGGCNHWWLCRPCLLIWQEIFLFSRQRYCNSCWAPLMLFTSLGLLRLFVTPLTVAHQVPLSMGFFRQKYWSGLPFLSPGDLFDSGIGPMSPALAGRFFTTGATIGSPHQWKWWCKVQIHLPSKKKLFTKVLVLVYVFNKDISA